MSRFRLGSTLFLLWVVTTCGCSLPPTPAEHQVYETSKTEELANPECVALRQRIEKLPFYHVLTRRYGASTAIECSIQTNRQELSYRFQQNAKLETRIQPQIEFEEQRLTLTGLSTKEGLEILRAAERHAFSNQSCGIAWDAAPESHGTESNYERIYRGNVCNCQGRLLYLDEQVVGLIFSSAC